MSILLSSKLQSGPILAHTAGWVSIGDGLEVLLPDGCEDGDTWDIELSPYTTPVHLGNVQVSDTIAISSEVQLLSLIQGNTVYTNNATNLSFDYPDKPSQPQVNHRSSILETLYNHVFLAKGRTLWWTDLDNYWNWFPSPESEADFRTFEWEKNDISGLAKLADVLYVFFPNMIYSVEYTGKPFVVHITCRVHGTGSINHRGITSCKSNLFFLGLDNFYVFSLQGGAQPIGGEIWEKFVNSTSDFTTVWSYVDLIHDEVCWVSGDTIWAFSITNKHWTKYSSNSILDHTTAPWYPTHPIISPSETNTLSSFDKVQPSGAENLWVTEEAVCRDQKETDGLEKCLELTTPYLETDDITYGDIHFHKKVDLLMIDGMYDFPWMGVRVKVSGRDYISEKKKWVECGVWVQDRKSKQIDFPAVNGRVLKFRFELVSDLDFSTSLNGSCTLNGRRDDVCDGRIVMDGVEDLQPRQIPTMNGVCELDGKQIHHPEQPLEWFDWNGVLYRYCFDLNGESYRSPITRATVRLNWFDFAAWGERVEIPQALVPTGPDK